MYVPRHSILNRPMRDGAKANEERQEVEYQKEMARIAAKAQRQAATEERLVGAYYATPGERRQAWSQLQQEAEQLAAARAAALSQERAREAAWLCQPQRVVVDTQRPWSAASSTYYMPVEVEEAARRAAQREASEVNRHMAQCRQATEAQQRVAEQEALRRAVVAEDTWFNRGAASERWIAPERRIKQRATVPQQFAHNPAPYYCDNEPSPAASATMHSQPRPGNARRAQEGQGVAAALRYDVPPAGGYSSRTGSVPPSPAGSVAGSDIQRPRTAPAAAQQQQQQKQYPWTWNT